MKRVVISKEGKGDSGEKKVTEEKRKRRGIPRGSYMWEEGKRKRKQNKEYNTTCAAGTAAPVIGTPTFYQMAPGLTPTCPPDGTCICTTCPPDVTM